VLLAFAVIKQCLFDLLPAAVIRDRSVPSIDCHPERPRQDLLSSDWFSSDIFVFAVIWDVSI
jgi:hypothetical protein